MTIDPRKYVGNPDAEVTGHKARQYRAGLAADDPTLASIFNPPTRLYQLPPPAPPSTRGKRTKRQETGL
jgi:hypothetical protein